MSERILEIRFDLKVPVQDYSELANQMADLFAEVPGLKWKIWLLDEERGEAGGIYLFEDDDSLRRYLDSSLAAEVKAHPGLKNLEARSFGVMPKPTSVTRGPLRTTTSVGSD